MGYYDEKWCEAKGYCVVCDCLRPLDKSAVCQDCWNVPPRPSPGCWQEDDYHSHWFYDRLRETESTHTQIDARKKKEFIIFGDYRSYCAPREDFKIFDFVLADTPEEAVREWRRSAREEGQDIETVVEQEVYVMEIEGTRWVFDLDSCRLCRHYRRTELD